MADGRRDDVLTGLERLLESGPACAGLSEGARIGLVAHPASVDRDLRHAVDLLAGDPRVTLVHLFGPEHGLRDEAQDMEPVDRAVDAETGLPVSSLYGSDAESLRPGREEIASLDAVVYDLQDVGSRYYTFIYTLSYFMEAARDADRPVVVLDRPNPIGGRAVEGPVLDPSLESFVGRYPIPVRHGMTTGELAGMFNEAFGIGCDLRVVPMTGWRRPVRFEKTGLPWVAPSPNMPTPDTARVYPGGCLVEGTNLSEGRGTTRPFELIGAPWLNGTALASTLDTVGLPGARFRSTVFRPMFHKHAGRTCGGIQVHVTDAEAFRPFSVYLAVVREAMRQERESFDWRREAYEFESDRLAIDLLLGRPDLRPMLESGASVEEMEKAWSAELAAFLELRERFLLYADRARIPG
jgi:beta-N-acetylhexosaminidase